MICPGFCQAPVGPPAECRLELLRFVTDVRSCSFCVRGCFSLFGGGGVLLTDIILFTDFLEFYGHRHRHQSHLTIDLSGQNTISGTHT